MPVRRRHALCSRGCPPAWQPASRRRAPLLPAGFNQSSFDLGAALTQAQGEICSLLAGLNASAASTPADELATMQALASQVRVSCCCRSCCWLPCPAWSCCCWFPASYRAGASPHQGPSPGTRGAGLAACLAHRRRVPPPLPAPQVTGLLCANGTANPSVNMSALVPLVEGWLGQGLGGLSSVLDGLLTDSGLLEVRPGGGRGWQGMARSG